MKKWWPTLLWLAAAAWMGWWLTSNPLPDGYQNEYLHVGNAFDLWGALTTWDVWHLRWYMYRVAPWPWGLHAPAAPLFALLGPSHGALVATNLLHLAVLLWATSRLGRVFSAPLAPLLVVLAPGVFGSLVRYEPNLAAIAWSAAALACAVSSRGLRDRGMVIGWGCSLGIGLMMDRLTVGFFALPVVLPYLGGLWGPERGRIGRNLALGGGAAAFLSAAYYREYALNQLSEVLQQVPVGEIDAAGAVTATGGALYYLWTLPDSQAGTVLGLAMVLGLGLTLVEVARAVRAGRRWQAEAALLSAVLLPVIFFTLVAKKQVFYTLPILAPLAVMVGRHPATAALGVLGGLWVFGVQGLGVLPGERLAAWALPAAWVSPRHVVARPPSFEDWPLDEAIADLPTEPGDLAARRAAPPGADGPSIAVFSEDDRLFEGFVALAVREGLPGAHARGITLDPQGTTEMLDHTQALLWVGPAGGGWPDAEDVHAELLADHLKLADYPEVGQRVEDAEEQFTEISRYRSGDLDLVVFLRTTDAPLAPSVTPPGEPPAGAPAVEGEGRPPGDGVGRPSPAQGGASRAPVGTPAADLR